MGHVETVVHSDVHNMTLLSKLVLVSLDTQIITQEAWAEQSTALLKPPLSNRHTPNVVD